MNTKELQEYHDRFDVIRSMDSFVSEAVDDKLMDPDDCWQPNDFLPDMEREDALDEIKKLRERAANIPNTVITSLVGNMITEEALPSYQTYFSLIFNEDKEVTSDKGWARWSRAWTAEENRHGDLLNKYLYLSGRCDMKKVEQTIHRLIYNGFDPDAEKDPYQSIIYTSFQERATKISHVNTGKLADKAGDSVLSKICKQIAGDEARHENAYKSFMTEIFKKDPNGAIAAFERMMRKQISMPAMLMDDQASKSNIFIDFSAITQQIGVYTTWDYAAIIDHLVKYWKIETLTGLQDGFTKAQDYLCRLSDRYKKIAERMKVPEEINLHWLSNPKFSF
ncbi:acyl-ACP desaturase [Elizabethkingia sp. HX WHF]|jgi:acyl-[acyl-carrier-protein] desaturase|uniref:Acyl-ACP desaturase n=3 Tax=Elizabethkingia TaxID=308865 RepID=A0ABD5B4L7_ELIMR|nr:MULTISPECIES: acyl-ACP desaturase [Elizabethkingia]MDR2228239.1 acyl-ACP desaturase [Flavobacteriaceae bacterium]AJW61586.1 Putative acyl-(acyl-carrier-protein) desaturase desA1 [Elizabethkingia miricola]AQX07528.1 stearoyl-CoA 9-desaturase [Elizabethkingia ursingii]AQX84400.1 stearoyl-CoA 9-desaturase [Elizabethkingia bruuniana]ATL43167.1 acyl-ACP desaturase [Elizabethkingia miricola]